ncbi:tetratricopeptide (TPR) repeat protein [Aquimarina sp. EL_43]|uniref:tetratricopeptide repeat-containing sensor histidine kinase n=1 Tax=unclassified Aquimarina TaxID=2627091 RepID=UPI0018C97C6E|nr:MULTISPECIES: histidine kinase [unclassified Aquimarina]MBG6129076.1 tetratricopeptide (TPR) repeat protein [Aquimarina sp. EL_35]MBG6150140.1 tetratricopeptide (TPR) repeat protein [Aquimarina sp. EL_32]MBG6167174.1 tetratricopeptide (TPR) repeat protein [Aquimarina sp. EL_43]
MKVITISLLLIIQITYAQEKELDSIKRRVDTYLQRDSTRVQLLNQLTKYYTLRDISKSKALLLEAIEISKEIGYISGLGSSYTGYSIFHTQSGNYDKGLVYALKAKKIQDSINDVSGLLLTNNCMARIYIHLKKSKKAIKIQLENLELLKNQPLSPQKAGIHFYLANAYGEINNFDEAEFHYKKAKYIAEKTKFTTGVYIANSSLGVLANRRGKFKEAILYLKPTLKFYEENNQSANIAHTNLEMAKSYANIGNVNKAIKLTDKAIRIYKDQKNLKSLQSAYLNQSNFYKRINNYLKANKFLEDYYKIKDSLFSYDNKVVMEEMQVKYETEKIKKDKELAEQKAIVVIAQKRQNKEYFIITLAGIGFLFLLSLFYFERTKIKRKAIFLSRELEETQKRLEIEKQYKESELKALKSQMNPHFIFNSLNSIQDLILQQNTDSSYDYIVLFAQLVRNTLNYSSKNFIVIEKELEFLDVYLQLEKLRFEDDFTYTIQSINTEGLSVLSLIVQPFIENALLHGLLHKAGKKQLTIDFTFTDHLLCTIIDNGIGRKEAKKIQERQGNHHESFALNAIQQRLEILKDQYGTDVGYQIFDLYNDQLAMGTRVEIRMPYQKEY